MSELNRSRQVKDTDSPFAPVGEPTTKAWTLDLPVELIELLNAPKTEESLSPLEIILAYYMYPEYCPGWMDLRGLSDELLVTMHLWVSLDYTPKTKEADYGSIQQLMGAIHAEGERRGWPEGWYEDPSRIPGMEEAEERPIKIAGGPKSGRFCVSGPGDDYVPPRDPDDADPEEYPIKKPVPPENRSG